MAKALTKPRAISTMVPAGAVDQTIDDLLPHLQPGDIVIDGGNSYYIDDLRRSKALTAKGILCRRRHQRRRLGRGRGYADDRPARPTWFVSGDLRRSGAPAVATSHARPGARRRRPEHCRGRYLRAFHPAARFVKMVHNGIEYGIMASYAEGWPC